MQKQDDKPAFTGLEWLLTHHKAKEKERQKMVKDLHFSPGEKVLDLACGPGLYSALIAAEVQPDGRVTGIDIDNNLLAYARTAIQGGAMGELMEFQSGSFYEIPFEDNSFDSVFLSSSLLYVPEKDHHKVITEIKRVTCPGGRIIIKDIDAAYLIIHPVEPELSLKVVLAAMRGLREESSSSHFNNFMGRRLHGLLQHEGLLNVTTRTYAIQQAYPLSDPAKEYISRTSEWFLEKAMTYLSQSDAEEWRKCFTAGTPDYVLDREDFYFCSLDIVSVGRLSN